MAPPLEDGFVEGLRLAAHQERAVPQPRDALDLQLQQLHSSDFATDSPGFWDSRPHLVNPKKSFQKKL